MSDELEALAQSRKNAARFPTVPALDTFRFYVWAVRGLLIGAVVAALWYARVEYKIVAYDKVMTEQWAKTSAFEAYIASNNLVNSTMQNLEERTIDRVKKNEGRLDMMDPKLSEMWFMKEHGISNKEDFLQKHGYNAPAGPEKP